MLTFDISGAQIDGARDYQEDAFLITHLGDSDNEGGSLVIVADGMGGHAAGNVASNMAVQTFNKHITSNFPSDDLSEVLRESVRQANNSISETVRETAALKGMGCTLVAAVLEDKFVRWVSVGDSHLYLIRNNEMKKKNADHSYGGFLDRMAAEGTPVEAEAGFSRNMLMSALTGEDIAEIDCPEALELQSGDRLIIASDGLDTLSEGKVLSFTAETSSPKECVEALLQGVEDAKMPRQDNTTVVIIEVGEKEDPTQQVAVAASTATETGEVEVDHQAARPRPFAVEEDEPHDRGPWLKFVAAGLLLLSVAAGGYWFMTQGSSKVSVDPGITDIGDDFEIEEDPNIEADPIDTVIEIDAEPVDVPPEVVETAPIGRGEEFTDKLKTGGSAPILVWIAAGRFTMGSRENSADFDERPQHTVNIERFAMSVHEITIAEYVKFAKSTGRKRPKTGDLDAETFPVFFVSWNDALAYTKWLSDQTGKNYRIPTEAEWEYATRARTTSEYWWGRQLGRDNAHCFACETGLDPRLPTRIGRFDENAFGVFDLAGNVEEWVYDCYHKDYAGAPSDGSVFEGGDCSVRVTRGGAYSSGPKALRSAARSKFRYDAGNDSIGIRVVRDP